MLSLALRPQELPHRLFLEKTTATLLDEPRQLVERSVLQGLSRDAEQDGELFLAHLAELLEQVLFLPIVGWHFRSSCHVLHLRSRRLRRALLNPRSPWYQAVGGG